MGKIKTKDAIKGAIRQLDRAAITSDRMRRAYIQAKEKAETSTNPTESNAEEYASARMESGVRTVLQKSAHQVEQMGKNSVSHVREDVSKESVKSAGKKSIKTTRRAAGKSAKQSIKTAESTAKTTVKTTKEAAQATERAAKVTAKSAQKAAQAAKAAAKAAAEGVKTAVRVTVAAIKAILAAAKALVTLILAGGWVAVLVIVLMCVIGLVTSSVFGIFFSGEDSGSGMTMQTAVREINGDYDARLEAEKNAVSYDSLEMSGSRAVWKEVLAVYAVRVNTDLDHPQEVATMDEGKKRLLSDIFWEMNTIASRTETTTSTVITETVDGAGNIVETETTETYTTLYITVSHKTAEEMAQQYGFTQKQRDDLAALLKDENNSLWSAVLYGIGYSDDQIVTVALSQIGNDGGATYWSWYGFSSREEWCACFVSWCANECGYLETGVIPKYSSCTLGAQWFKGRGQWMDNSAEPTPGMIIFFDWDGKDGQDGAPDHTGIVQKVEDGKVYTIEGNSGDSVRCNSYPIGYYEIYGYGAPQY